MLNSTRSFMYVIVFLLPVLGASGQPTYNAAVKQAAFSLYQSFEGMQKHSGLFDFADTARIQWNNLPVGLRARVGTSIGDMTEDQRKLLHRVLSVSLSSQGYLKATGIMHLDDLLNGYYERLFYKKAFDSSTYSFIRELKWSHKNYFFAFFGNPADSIWGYKLEGHHLSVNFTFCKDKLSVTPFFIGTDPAEYPDTEYAGWRVLGQEEDLGMKMMQLLSPAQQKMATISGAVPQDIITGAESGKRLVSNRGIVGAAMNRQQQAALTYIIREFVFNMEYEKASLEYEKILKAGIDKIYFDWIGEYDEKKPHYYVLNGPSFIIEFDNNGGPQNSANHIHAIWREKGNEFGEDVLKKHYQTEKH